MSSAGNSTGAEDRREEGNEDQQEPGLVLQSMLCLVATLEGADTALLGASLKALMEDIGLHFMDVGKLTAAQAVCTNVAAPLWGILADRGILSRRAILVIGSLGQGIVTILLAFITGLWPMLFLRSLNGIMLAALRPISNGIVADVTGESKRGKIFGRVQSALLFGMFITNMTVLPIATEDIIGIQGWRIAYVVLGLISVLVSMYVWAFMPPLPHTEEEEEEEKPSPEKGGAVLEELKSLLKFAKMPTFCIMIMQGIFGTIPWSVMGYASLFYQLCGVSNNEVALLGGAGPLLGACGNVIGGLVSDSLAGCFGLHGRPLNAQISVSLGMPLMYLTFMGVPPGSGTFWIYMTFTVLFGLVGSWAQSGTNFPILAHIVPADARSRVMAWECALENSIANFVGPLAASFLAEEVFNFKFGAAGHTDGVDLVSAGALGKAMTATICLPWSVCFLAYTFLHWSYPRDVKRLEAAVAQKQQASAQKTKAQDEGNLEVGHKYQSNSDLAVESNCDLGDAGADVVANEKNVRVEV